MPDYADGTPIWVDVSTPDLEASTAFYRALFGWDAYSPPDGGGYAIFSKGGKSVAGLGPTMSPDQPPAWATYLQTSDLKTTAQAVKDNGGQVVFEPMDVMDQGSMAVFTDPTGAFICAWQPGQHRGAELVNEPGAFAWNELYTRDMPAAKAFYQKVFGLSSEDNDMGNGSSYTEFKVDGRSVAGGMDMSSILPADIPPHWLVYFTVDNCDGSLAKIEELGGKALNPPMDIPIGRFAVVQDPVGAVFAIFRGKPQE